MLLFKIIARLLILVVYSCDYVVYANHNNVEKDSAPSAYVRHQNWQRIEMMDSNGLYWLQWRIIEKDIYFKVTVNTRGFIGLGFSRRDGRMSNADMVLLWVDDHTGKLNALVSIFKDRIFTKSKNLSIYL